jgi:phage protein D
VEDDPSKYGAADFKVKLAGADVTEDQLHSWAVDAALGQADMCTLTLKNQGHRFSNRIKPGDPLEVTLDDICLFKGEVVAVEPMYRTGTESKCVIRGFNRLHRLLRGRKSRTWLKKSYQDIAGDIAKDAGLTAKCGSSPQIKPEHTYQHNQDNLSFLRTIAARVGYEVWCEGTDLYFDAPKLDRDSGIELKIDDAADPEHKLASFAPRMSSAAVVKKVTVRGWDPEQKKEIVGEEEVSSSKLGDKTGIDASTTFGATATFEVDYPIFTPDEAKAIAKAKLDELSMSYITGEGACKGNPKIKPGVVVKLIINVEEASDRFNGKYLVTKTTHSYTPTKGGAGNDSGGTRTTFAVCRDAQASGAQGSDQAPVEAVEA